MVKTTRAHAAVFGIGIVIAILFVGLAVHAASGESRRPGPLFAGVRLGYSPDGVAAFSQGYCTRKEQLADWFIGVRLHRHLAVTMNIMDHDDFDAECAVEAPELPIPPLGPYTKRDLEYGDGIQKDPHYSSEIDFMAEPLPARYPASFRMLVGCGWMWTKDIPFWTAGLGFDAGNRRVRFVFDVKKSWFQVPYERIAYYYQDGVLVDRHAIGQHTNEHPLAIMAGLELGIPWLT